MFRAIDAVISKQPEMNLTRSDIIRFAVADYVAANGVDMTESEKEMLRT